MVSKNAKIIAVIFLIAFAAIFYYYFYTPPVTDGIPKAPDSTTIEEEPIFEEKLTTVYVYGGDFFFGGEEMPHDLLFFYYSPIEEGIGMAGIDENDYYFFFSDSSDTFDIYNDDEKFFGSYSFKPGEINSVPISLGSYPKEYNYYVSKDKQRMFLLLSSQEFPLQFGKNLIFEGTDCIDDEETEREYFYPSLEEFGFEHGEKACTAIFSFDEDEDFEGDARLFIDTATFKPIEEDSRDSYKWQIEFKHNGNWVGYNLEDDYLIKQNSFGSVLSRNFNEFYIMMPDKD